MPQRPKSPDDYVKSLPAGKRAAIESLRSVIRKNLPKGFEETVSYGMIGYVVPHKLYPNGYHCDPKLPLPFVNIAAQKNFFALYHMGLYADSKLREWFTSEFPRHSERKLDMGKSCVRFKSAEEIPLKLIGQLLKKISVKKWIEIYETGLRPRK
ncbi:MAG: DUF1801 domain-containing protein [Spirochaetota bacterium]